MHVNRPCADLFYEAIPRERQIGMQTGAEKSAISKQARKEWDDPSSTAVKQPLRTRKEAGTWATSLC